jgi:hypothetical protein
MKRVLLLSAVTLIALVSSGQKNKSDKDVLMEGDLTLSEVQDALSLHLSAHPDTYVLVKPEYQEKVPVPGIVVFKDNHIELDWTTGQHAHSLSENLRLGVYELAAQKSEGIDLMAIDHAKRIWPNVKALYCHEYPGARYFDLSWHEQYCEETRQSELPQTVKET